MELEQLESIVHAALEMALDYKVLVPSCVRHAGCTGSHLEGMGKKCAPGANQFMMV